MRYLTLSLCFVLFCSPTALLALDESDLHTEDVKVLRVLDGDTLLVKFSNNSEGSVRMLGIQAFEENDESTHIPECNATNATDRLAVILGCGIDVDCSTKPIVTLKVWDTSLTSYGRKLRFVFKGAVNVGLQLVEEGYVLAWPDPDETLYNEELMIAQQDAMEGSLGPLWNSALSQCGDDGPGHGAQLELWVNWDAVGDDSLPENRNGEWVKIRNVGVSSVNLSYWTLRDIGQQEPFKFPAGTSLAAGGTITVFVGSGTNSGTKFYMNESYSLFDNYNPDGAYLLDYWKSTSQVGHIIASFTYPCLQNCSDPLQGAVRMTVNYDAAGDDSTNPNGEWVGLKNISSSTINFEKYLLHSDPVGSSILSFSSNSTVYAGETMWIYIGHGTDSRLEKYWGNDQGILVNSEDRVWFDTYDSILITSKSWPTDEPEAPSGNTVIAPILYLLQN